MFATLEKKDAAVYGRLNRGEKDDLCKMVNRSSISNGLVIADRDYESYNLMAHIQEKGWKYLIRVKDIQSTGITSGLDLPVADTFDAYFPFCFTKRQNAEAIPAIWRLSTPLASHIE